MLSFLAVAHSFHQILLQILAIQALNQKKTSSLRCFWVMFCMQFIDKNNQPAGMSWVKGFYCLCGTIFQLSFRGNLRSALFSLRGRNTALVFILLTFIYTAGGFSSALEHGIAFSPYRTPERAF